MLLVLLLLLPLMPGTGRGLPQIGTLLPKAMLPVRPLPLVVLVVLVGAGKLLLLLLLLLLRLLILPRALVLIALLALPALSVTFATGMAGVPSLGTGRIDLRAGPHHTKPGLRCRSSISTVCKRESNGASQSSDLLRAKCPDRQQKR